MSPTVEVRFRDVTRSSYKFVTMRDFSHWHVLPRVGDFLLDGNEFQYVVQEVIWYGPYSAHIVIHRRDE